jgi:diacylglycerol kinase (ATP)
LKKLHLLINPIAGHGLAPKIEGMISSSNLSKKYEITVLHTQYAGHAKVLAQEAVANHIDVVVAVGGDGTVNEVGSALVNTNTTLGIIPAGSGNGLANHIGMKNNPKLALDQLASGSFQKIDSLQINGRFAVNVSGFGFDGYVAWLFNNSGKRGLSNYTKIGMQEYFKYPIANFKINHEGKSFDTEAHMIVIANASQFGNAAVISPLADITDGKLEMIAVTRPGLFKIPGMFYRLFTGKLKDNKYLRTIHCTSFTAESNRPLHLHIDGEAIDPLSKIEVKLNKHSLQIIQPQ